MKSTSTIELNTQKAAHAFWKKIALHYDVRRIILFGSRARNTHESDSDADIAVLLNGTAGRFITTKFAMDDLAYDVLLETGIRIQPLPIWQTEWDHPERYSNPELLKNIQAEGIVL